uniref:Uncharacterized protein n=1 Tax=Pyxicephalus adspersus TaxID=30357 RepID=A0AAV2ZY93_PYXAD|nr:TPA: hypothetical protein GDO54_014887 [Pyxicephalus adspersus]
MDFIVACSAKHQGCIGLHCPIRPVASKAKDSRSGATSEPSPGLHQSSVWESAVCAAPRGVHAGELNVCRCPPGLHWLIY